VVADRPSQNHLITVRHCGRRLLVCLLDTVPDDIFSDCHNFGDLSAVHLLGQDSVVGVLESRDPSTPPPTGGSAQDDRGGFCEYS